MTEPQPIEDIDRSSPRPDDIRVVFHSPFATERLDEKKVTRAPRATWQAAVDRLNSTSGVESLWRASEGPRLRLQGYEQALLSDLMSRMPRPILETVSAAAMSSLGDPLVAAHRNPARCTFPDAEGTAWSLGQIELTLWNTGAGLVSATYDVTKPPELGWERFAATVSRLRAPARADLIPWIKMAVGGFSEFCEEQKLVHGWTSTPDAEDAFWSEPLWTYRSSLVVLGSNGAEASVVAKALVDDGDDYEQSEASRVLRIGFSACLVAGGRDVGLETMLMGLLETHTACWASAIALDSFISDRLLELEFGTRPDRDLGQEPQQLLRLADKVRFFLITVQDVPIHLDTGDYRLWRVLDESWRFPEFRDRLNDKLDTLRGLHGALTSQLGGQRLRRLNNVALWLTAIGGVGAVVAMLAYVQGSPQWVGVLCLLVAGLLAATLLITARE